MPVVRVRLPLKVTVFVAVVLVMTSDAALTAPVKVTPPEFVIVTVPISVAIVVVIPTVLFELITTCDAVPLAVPAMELIVMTAGPPLPKVKVTPSVSVMFPRTTASDGLT